MSFNLKDKELRETLTLPNGAATTNSDPIQLHDQDDALKTFVANCELRLKVPALGATPLPDGQTITYSIQQSDTADFASADTISGGVVQTGAGGAGAAATEIRIRPPTNVKKYVRARAVKTGAANASTAAATFEVLF